MPDCLHTGVGIAFLASLIFKTKFLRHHHAPLESCMVGLCPTACAFCLLGSIFSTKRHTRMQVIILAFSSYMLADSFGLSGIVSILFCGLVCICVPFAYVPRAMFHEACPSLATHCYGCFWEP